MTLPASQQSMCRVELWFIVELAKMLIINISIHMNNRIYDYFGYGLIDFMYKNI